MEHKILQVLADKYHNQIEESTTNIEMFLANPTGVAEHIVYVETVEKELEKISHAQDMIEALDIVRFQDEKLNAYNDEVEETNSVDYEIK